MGISQTGNRVGSHPAPLRVVGGQGEDALADYERDGDPLGDLGVERWVEPDGDLVRYENPSAEGVESEWAGLDWTEDRLNMKRGALADVVSRNRVYGHGNLRTFAYRTGYDVSSLYDYLATYRRLSELSESARVRVLALNVRYSHLRVMNVVKDDVAYEELLNRANDENWVVGRLARAAISWRDLRKAGDVTVGGASPDEQGPASLPSGHDPGPASVPPVRETSETSESTSTPARDSIGEGSDVLSYSDTLTVSERDRSMIQGFLDYAEGEDVELGVWKSRREGDPLEFVPLDGSRAFAAQGAVAGLIEEYLKAR